MSNPSSSTSLEQMAKRLASNGRINEDPADEFAAVLVALQRAHILPLVKTKRQLETKAASTVDAVAGDTLYGSYHILVPVHFVDGISWLIKVPKNGSEGLWDDLSAAALAAEASTMRLLRRETTIPVPNVFDFSSTTRNVLHCPYIMMEFVSGQSLYDVWFGRQLKGQDAKSVHQCRVRALKGIASAMVQLSQYGFKKSGSPVFDAKGELSGIGRGRCLDHQGMLDRWFIHQDPSDDPIYVQVEPSSEPKDHFLFPLELHRKEKPNTDGLVLVLRQLIQWLPQAEIGERFVLTHPDFDIQNFLVSEDGELQAIIDWDGICAVPRSIGNESLPGWLTRDWDPIMYAYNESMDEGVEPEGVWEDSPAVLKKYRSIYRDLMREQLGIASREQRLDITARSLIAENLSIAARDPACRHGILEKVMQEIDKVTNGCFKWDVLDLGAAFSDGSFTEIDQKLMKSGFLDLLEKAGSL